LVVPTTTNKQKIKQRERGLLENWTVVKGCLVGQEFSSIFRNFWSFLLILRSKTHFLEGPCGGLCN
ncbi:hypothetical protein DVW31_15530, partial [Enterococcus faecium]|uniref:hypothetical protein n=1 Tax=Enterococcus faecium TaxID=1352 RepID=UPI00113688E0